MALLQAAIWDRMETEHARPYWKTLSESPVSEPPLKQMAKSRMAEIDSHPEQKVAWKISGVGRLPELDWSSRTLKEDKGPYHIYAKSEFPKVCVAPKNLLVPTRSWIKKIGEKYDNDYHPYVYLKSLIRFPIGVAYGIVGVSSGVAIGIGGCGLAASAGKNGNAEACKASLELGGFLIVKSADLVEFTLQPDMRHWKDMPIAFYLERATTTEDPSGAGADTERETASDQQPEKSCGEENYIKYGDNFSL
jgi:hypothetical protein